MNDTYKTIDTSVEEIVFKEKSSKFLGYAFPVKSEDEVKKHLENVKKVHHAARHWCYAWRLGNGTTQKHRANDDGEPNNSAGIPIYGQIQSFELTDILVIVVRYFGGIKLGVGGLVQAYKTTAQLTLEQVQIVEKRITKTIIISFDYKNMNKVMRVVKERNLQVSKQILEEKCTLYIDVAFSEAEQTVSVFETIYELDVCMN
ncbi:IMPACT family protein [Capnocytophaga canimorsus]